MERYLNIFRFENFLIGLPQKVENIGLISIRSSKKVWLTNTSTKKCIYTLSEQLSQSLILVLEVYVRKSWIGFNTFARRKCHSRFINNSKRLLSTQCDDPRPRGFYDQSNVFFRRLKFQTLYQEKYFKIVNFSSERNWLSIFLGYIELLNSRSKIIYILKLISKHISQFSRRMYFWTGKSASIMIAILFCSIRFVYIQVFVNKVNSENLRRKMN